MRLGFSLALLVCLLATGLRAQGSKTVEREKQFKDTVQPLLKKYCFECHGGGTAEGDFSFDKFTSLQSVVEGRKEWFKVLRRTQLENMPPKDTAARPTKEEYALIAKFVDVTLHDIDCSGPPIAGHVTIRRLTRYEYRNTVRDLLGVDYLPAAGFPADEVGYGFDNIGDVLSLPPILLEKYLTAAEDITAKAILSKLPPPLVVRNLLGSRLRAPGEDEASRRGRREEVRPIKDNGHLFSNVDFPGAGKYIIRVTAFGDQAGDEAPKLVVQLDDEELKTFEVKNEKEGIPFEFEHQVAKGFHQLKLVYPNDFFNADEPDEKRRDRNLNIMRLEVFGPLKTREESLPESHTKLLTVTPELNNLSWEDAARQVLKPFVSRAFRRPAQDAEVERLVKVSLLAKENGDNFETGIQLAVQAALVSPHFLFKVEATPEASADKNAARRISDYELATRLSYFLWSTMPDQELFDLAAANKLREGDNLPKQVRRLLSDNRSQALVENFAIQWLTLRNLETVQPNQRRFRDFNNELRQAMLKETELFIGAVIREDLSLLRLLDGDFTFVNEQLAKLYGIPDITGNEFRKVSLAGTPRAGILTQASILTVTSNPTRTSPVKRGKWILENLLNEPPPPPPPDVPELKEERQLTGTLRERMQKHRENATCNSCHQTMDALGFSLENFDGIGAFREMEGTFPVDASGELPTGEKFKGAAELRTLLLNTKRKEFVACATEKMLTYALGRGLEYYDQCTVADIIKKLEQNDHRFSTLIVEIVQSYPFQHQGVKRSE